MADQGTALLLAMAKVCGSAACWARGLGRSLTLYVTVPSFSEQGHDKGTHVAELI